MWYKIAYKRLIALEPLEAEALKYDNFEDFEKAFLVEIKHGKYWHITDDPNFTINHEYSPRDMSSMSTGSGNNPGLMITSHLEHWVNEFPDRKYVAEIDMSNVPKSEYYQVNRGFGNEFWVTPEGVQKARVVKIYPLQSALRASSKYSFRMPNNSQELENIWHIAHEKQKIKNGDI